LKVNLGNRSTADARRVPLLACPAVRISDYFLQEVSANTIVYSPAKPSLGKRVGAGNGAIDGDAIESDLVNRKCRGLHTIAA
jgi:hypothetical protein